MTHTYQPTNPKSLRLVFLVLSMATLFSTFVAVTAVFADEPVTLPTPVNNGDVTYLSGGIGDEEKVAMESAKKDYNVTILNINHSGEYLTDTHFVISDKEGNKMLNTDSDPMLFVNLPKGQYTVEAQNGDQVTKKEITVSNKKPVNLTFSWNAS